jgi:nitrite reductase (NADH) small subunit
MGDEYVDVCGVDELSDKRIKVFRVGTRAIAVVSVDGVVRAFANVCPHRGGPLGLGRVACKLEADGVGAPMARADEWVLVCPWHAWEFSLDDGSAVADPSAARARVYDTEVSDGRVRVSFARRTAVERTGEMMP